MKHKKKYLMAVLLTCCLIAFPISTPIIGTYVAKAATKQLNKSKLTVYVGDSYTLQLKGASSKVTWSSSNEKVATVSTKGKVIGVKKGTTTITASVSGQKYQCKVYVKYAAISESNLVLEIGDSKKLLVDGIKGKIKWKSKDTSVARVSNNGCVFAMNHGTTTIQGTYQGKTYSCKVNVADKVIYASTTDITCSSETIVLVAIDDLTYEQYFHAQSQDNKVVTSEWGEWKGDYATLIITPVGVGKTNITITSDNTKEQLDIWVTVVDEKRPKTKKLDAEAVYEKCSSATVQINTDIAQGSGFFIDQGVVVTNYHVIAGASSIDVKLQNGESYPVSYILGYDPSLDIALLYVPVETSTLPISSHDSKVGETVYAIGSPYGFTDTLTNGIISSMSRQNEKVDFIQTNAAISHGNSGGPLINSYGEVIGINTLTSTQGQNLNFAVDINQIYQVGTECPITVAEFTKLYYDFVLLEDTKNSSNINTCQQLKNYCGVSGCAVPMEKDYYKFVVEEDSTISVAGAAYSDTNDTYDLNLVIYDAEGNALAHSEINTIGGRLVQSITHDFSAGTYYVCILTDPNKVTKEIPYYFAFVNDMIVE